MSTPTLPECRHRGPQFARDRWMCMSPRLVACQGVTSDVCSEICPYVDHEYPPPKSSESAPDLGEGYGVAIGTYDSLHDDCRRFGTEAVKLNLAVLRATCGKDIKILVCDDASPSASQRCYRRLCEEYGAEFSTNQERMGHTSGDMIVFHKAIHWARQHRLKTVTKLSHRMVIDARNWLQEDSQQLLASGFATQGADVQQLRRRTDSHRVRDDGRESLVLINGFGALPAASAFHSGTRAIRSWPYRR